MLLSLGLSTFKVQGYGFRPFFGEGWFSVTVSWWLPEICFPRRPLLVPHVSFENEKCYFQTWKFAQSNQFYLCSYVPMRGIFPPRRRLAPDGFERKRFLWGGETNLVSVRAGGMEVVFLVRGVWDLFQIYALDFNSSFCVVLYRSVSNRVLKLLAIFPPLWAALGFPPVGSSAGVVKRPVTFCRVFFLDRIFCLGHECVRRGAIT